VESEVNKGTTFTFWVPVYSEEFNEKSTPN